MTPPPPTGVAPRVSGRMGWVIISCIILCGWSCKKSETTPVDSTRAEQPSDAPAPQQQNADKVKKSNNSQSSRPENQREIRFISHNVENWLTMDRYEDRKPVGSKPKPDSEKKQVIRILSEGKPDIIGLCEVGTKQDLEEIQRMMEDAGVPLPHLHHSTGPDPVRSLGLLSRYPIESTKSPATMEYRMNGKTFGMNRGILDATVNADGVKFRFLGAHLKSKREVPEGDQEAMRVNEARLLRQHVDSILKSDADAPLVVYGDFNDTYPSATVRTICRNPDPAFRLRPVYLRDSRREAWTHHWEPHDIYSRIDFVTTSASLNDRVDYKSSRIIDDAAWDQASDHRPLLVVFR